MNLGVCSTIGLEHTVHLRIKLPLAALVLTLDAARDAANLVSVGRVGGDQRGEFLCSRQFLLRPNVVVLYRCQRHDAEPQQNSSREDESRVDELCHVMLLELATVGLGRARTSALAAETISTANATRPPRYPPKKL